VALTAACKPVSTAVPLLTSYFVPPSKIMTTVCSGSISASDMLTYAALAIVFAILSIGIPHTVASFVGGSIGLALAHAFEATYIARTVVHPVTSALKKGFEGIANLTKSKESSGGDQSAMQTILAQHQRETNADKAASATTEVLNPFDGQPPGYNYRPPNGASPSPNGPALPPGPNNSPGGGAAALEYHPGGPGNYTREIAVDVTELQKGNGNGTS